MPTPALVELTNNIQYFLRSYSRSLNPTPEKPTALGERGLWVDSVEARQIREHLEAKIDERAERIFEEHPDAAMVRVDQPKEDDDVDEESLR